MEKPPPQPATSGPNKTLLGSTGRGLRADSQVEALLRIWKMSLFGITERVGRGRLSLGRNSAPARGPDSSLTVLSPFQPRCTLCCSPLSSPRTVPRGAQVLGSDRAALRLLLQGGSGRLSQRNPTEDPPPSRWFPDAGPDSTEEYAALLLSSVVGPF